MSNICCDVADCKNILSITCIDCDPVRLLCSDHDAELHIDGGIQHERKPYINKCSFIRCDLPITTFCKTLHKAGYCDSHNKLVHPKEHKCSIMSAESLVEIPKQECPACTLCGDCNGKLFRTCHTCKGKGFEFDYHCTRCNDGLMKCPQCYGDGYQNIEYNYNTVAITCGVCKGNGRIICTICDGHEGRTQCYKCDGNGKEICFCVKYRATNECMACGQYKHVKEWNRYKEICNKTGKKIY